MVNLKKSKREFITYFVILVVSCIVGGIFYKSLGKKDTAMLVFATAALLYTIYLIKVDVKKSIMFFIILLPVFVTARKAVFFDFLFLKISYESIYIMILFIFNITKILKFKDSIIKNKHNVKYFIYIFIFIIFAFNSMIFSKDVIGSFCNTFYSVLIPIMLMLCIIVNYDKSNIKNILLAFIVSIDFSSIYGFMQIMGSRLFSLSKIQANKDLLTFGYNNVNIFAGILIVITPMILNMIIYDKNSKGEKIFLYSSLVLNVCTLIVTFSRGVWICFIISTILVLFNKKYKKLVYGVLIVVILLSKKIFTFIMLRGDVLNVANSTLLQNESLVARIQSFFTCIKIILKYPFGIGEGNFEHMYKAFALKGYLMMPDFIRNNSFSPDYALEMAHNLWLQIAVDFGIIAAAAFLLIVLNRLIVSAKIFKINRGLFIAIINYIIFSLLTGAEFVHKGIVTETLIIWAIFACTYIISKGEDCDNI